MNKSKKKGEKLEKKNYNNLKILIYLSTKYYTW